MKQSMLTNKQHSTFASGKVVVQIKTQSTSSIKSVNMLIWQCDNFCMMKMYNVSFILICT